MLLFDSIMEKRKLVRSIYKRGTMSNLAIPFFIFGAKYAMTLSFVVAGGYFLKVPREEQKRMILFTALALPLIYVTALIASSLYDNPRPFVVGDFTPLIPHAANNGFPSDHTLLVSAIAAVCSFYSRRVGAILWMIALYVGMSRVYVGVHHPVDIVGSAVIAVVVSLIVFQGIKVLKK
jgi:undecaprenyl-diphosphatase